MHNTRNKNNINFNTFFDEIFNTSIGEILGADNLNSNPKVNIINNEDNYILSLACPGLTKEDLNISVEKRNLIISADVKSDSDKEIKYSRREFNYGKFRKSFPMSKNIDLDKIDASYDNGILHIKLSKLVETTPEKRIVDIK